MFLTIAPDARLASFVEAYWFIQDMPGEFAGSAIRTSPIPLAVLSVTMGRPNATEDGTLIPRAAMLGIQSRARSWQSWSDTYFVMAMLTIGGIVRLFPNTGAACADALVDLGTVTGDMRTNALSNGIDAALAPRSIAARLDNWLISRLELTRPVPESARILHAHAVLRGEGSVDMAAKSAQVNRRQLHRWYQQHFGKGPKELAELERLHRSLRGMQTGNGDPVSGFSDQAHQIRNWRQRLGVTPGSYASEGRSELASRFNTDSAAVGSAFYL